MQETLELLPPRTGVHVLIDYLSLTFPFICYEDDFELKIVDEVVAMISNFLNFPKDQVHKDDYAGNRYQYQYTIGENIILRLVGPELKSGYHSCFLELRGQGCREYELASEENTWHKLLEFFLIRLNAQITRIDIAIDDYEGQEVDFLFIKSKLERKLYSSNFRKKFHRLIGSEEEGWTLQMGGRQSTQILQIYDKLKEQQTKNRPVNQKYWLRYEMRFFLDKAYNVAMSMFDHGEANFRSFVLGLLLQILDIKGDNNYSHEDQYKIATDQRWLNFLEQVEKAKIEKYKIPSTSYLAYQDWASPHIGFYFLATLIECGGDDQQTITRCYQECLKSFNKIDKAKVKKLNRFRKELGLKIIDEEYLEQLRQKIEKILEERSLPF